MTPDVLKVPLVDFTDSLALLFALSSVVAVVAVAAAYVSWRLR